MANNNSKKYPIKEDLTVKIKFWALYVALPALLAFIALFSLGGLIWDVQIGGLGFAASFCLKLFALIICGGGAGYLYFKCLRFGSFKGFLRAENSRSFKNNESGFLSQIKEKYLILSQNIDSESKKISEEKEECLRDFKYCEDRLKGYKNFYTVQESECKLESAVFIETNKLSGICDASPFNHSEFAATLKKVRFCIAERFTGLKAEAYRGGGGYVFISYSHADAKVALSTVKRLQEAKINVWFDEGITEGEDWMDHLAKKIDGCAHFLMFQTKNYINSVNCNVEIKRALKMNKTILRLILDDAKLPEGIEMYLDAIQAHDGRMDLDDKINKIIKQLTAV